MTTDNCKECWHVSFLLWIALYHGRTRGVVVGTSGNLSYNFLVCLVYAAHGLGYFFCIQILTHPFNSRAMILHPFLFHQTHYSCILPFIPLSTHLFAGSFIHSCLNKSYPYALPSAAHVISIQDTERLTQTCTQVAHKLVEITAEKTEYFSTLT